MKEEFQDLPLDIVSEQLQIVMTIWFGYKICVMHF